MLSLKFFFKFATLLNNLLLLSPIFLLFQFSLFLFPCLFFSCLFLKFSLLLLSLSLLFFLMNFLLFSLFFLHLFLSNRLLNLNLLFLLLLLSLFHCLFYLLFLLFLLLSLLFLHHLITLYKSFQIHNRSSINKSLGSELGHLIVFKINLQHLKVSDFWKFYNNLIGLIKSHQLTDRILLEYVENLLTTQLVQSWTLLNRNQTLPIHFNYLN